MILGMGDRRPLRRAGREHEGAARPRATTRSSSGTRRAARQGPRDPRPQRGSRQHPHRHRLARVGRLRSRRQDRREGPHHRRRQHRDGLLPDLRAARRQGHQGDGAQAAQVLQGLAVGARRRGGGAGRDRHQPRAEALRARERPPQGDGVPALRVGGGRARAVWCRPRSTPCFSRPTTSSSPSGRRARFPGSSATSASSSTSGTCPVVDKMTIESTRPGVFFGGDAAWGPQNIIWAVEHGHQAAISASTTTARGSPLTERPPQGMTLASAKMGIHEWSYSNDYNPDKRQKMKHVDLVERFKKLDIEVETGLHRRADRARGRALPQLRHPDGVHRSALHRVRRVHRRLPGPVPHHHDGRRGARAAQAPQRARDEPEAGPLRLGPAAADADA